MEELMFECESQTTALKVTEILRALRVTVKQIEENKLFGAYYLIHIKVQEKMVQIRGYMKRHLAVASEDYLNIEKSLQNSQGDAVVLVSASSIKSLKKAYPSYFLDTSEFITILETINENCNKIRTNTR